jgi:penicillin amidase
MASPSRVLLPLLCVVMLTAVGLTQAPQAGRPATLPGLIDAAQLLRDVNDIAHIDARNPHDLYFLQGYVHAQDRLFQMDVSRRQASGTLAELVGPSALGSDVQLRTFGLRRAAARSLPALTSDTRLALEAYAAGVNAWLATHALPPEYGALEITRIPRWTALDSVAIAKLIAFGLSFDLEDIDRTVALKSYTTALGAAGQALFFEDVYRSQPFDPASTVPDASQPAAAAHYLSPGAAPGVDVDERAFGLAKKYLDEVKDIAVLKQWRENRQHGGSNEWGVSGRLTEAGFPLLANDPHLSLGTPATWYPIHLRAGSLDVIGNGFPGTPFVTLGHNTRVAWGATVNPMDVTDVFSEQVVPDAHSPSGFSTLYLGQLEPVMPIPEVFRANQPADGVKDDVAVVPPGGSIPAYTLIVPRRNNGPIISLDKATGAALSVQYTGFSATRELDAFRLFNEAGGLEDFRQALEYFDFGSQNFAYADVTGVIAYFTSAEMPVREDLQAGAPHKLPPYFIRDGAGGNEWMPVVHPQRNQAIAYEILPPEEMPHVVNPPAGWFVNANNDPAGTTLDNDPLNQLRPGGGIYYLNPGYSQFRAGRITQLIREKVAAGPISFSAMQQIQADTTLLDAQFFVPHILRASGSAQAAAPGTALRLLASEPRIQEAVRRLAAWNFTTPTGIAQGYDARVAGGAKLAPSPEQVANSVAATIYSGWRTAFMANTIDAVLGPLPKPPGDVTLSALRHLLEQFAVTHGVGASGLPFFNGPGATPEEQRDFVILESLAEALDLLASPSMSAAFAGSSNQDDYRWGKLHRIVFAHVLDDQFSIPPAGGAFPAPLVGLPGIPTDGGFETVDASTHDARAKTVNGFMFRSGPSNRTVHEGRPGGMQGASSLPGGPSGTIGSPFYFNLLPQWLVNQAYPFLQRQSDLQHNLMSVEKFVPAGT